MISPGFSPPSPEYGAVAPRAATTTPKWFRIRGTNAPSASSGLDNIDQTVAVSNTLTLSSRTVNETRAQIQHGDLQALHREGVFGDEMLFDRIRRFESVGDYQGICAGRAMNGK